MLKIKDNVDLKELEKFGFKKYTTGNLESYYQNLKFINGYEREICVDENSHLISIDYYDYEFTEKFTDILYDLIKADLVEKVKE